MMCQRIGLPPISIIGLGFRLLSSEMRVPSPPARMTTFMASRDSCAGSAGTVRDRLSFVDHRIPKLEIALRIAFGGQRDKAAYFRQHAVKGQLSRRGQQFRA